MNCKFMVPERPHYIRYNQCLRNAVEDGYCKQHARKVREREAFRKGELDE